MYQMALWHFADFSYHYYYYYYYHFIISFSAFFYSLDAFSLFQRFFLNNTELKIFGRHRELNPGPLA